ncbi:MAG TPA: triphosphoribosyl-dephospho-CoA synthase, partial [Pirellulales bacterium]
GLGDAPQADVAGPAPAGIVEAMRLAADRDLVARQWTNDFSDVLTRVAPWILAAVAAGRSLHDAIVETHIRLMAVEPDSLIARKAGRQTAIESAAWAAAVLNAGPPGSPEFYEAASDLDFWLRSDGRRRNPGTTADLIAAGLFALLRDDRLPRPIRWSA